MKEKSKGATKFASSENVHQWCEMVAKARGCSYTQAYEWVKLNVYPKLVAADRGPKKTTDAPIAKTQPIAGASKPAAKVIPFVAGRKAETPLEAAIEVACKATARARADRHQGGVKWTNEEAAAFETIRQAGGTRFIVCSRRFDAEGMLDAAKELIANDPNGPEAA